MPQDSKRLIVVLGLTLLLTRPAPAADRPALSLSLGGGGLWLFSTSWFDRLDASETEFFQGSVGAFGFKSRGRKW